MPEDHARASSEKWNSSISSRASAVVAFRGLLQHGQVRLEVVAVSERDAVDALQHRRESPSQ